MRKILTAVLCIALLFSSISTAFAQESANDEKITTILKQIKQRIPDTEDYSEFRSDIRSYSEISCYEFEWQNPQDNKYMSVTVYEDGVITGFTVYDENKTYDNKPTIKKKSLKETGDKALELFFELNPMLENKIEIILPDYNSLYGNEYTFRLKRVENGVEVRGNNGSITIDKDAKKIESLYLNYSPDLTFADKTEFIEPDDAKKAYIDIFGMKPVYNIIYGKGDLPETQLVYELSCNSDEYIDALSGNAYSYTPERVTYNSAGGSSAMKENLMLDSGAAEEMRLSEAESKEIDKISGLKSKDEIISAVISNYLLDIDKNAEVSRISLIRNYNNKDKYYYSISMDCPDGEKGYNISVDASDESIISYSRYDYKIDRSSKVTHFAISPEEYALKLGAKYFTDDAGNTYQLEKQTDESVLYKRVVNGIDCSFDRMSVTLNSYDGKLDYYYVSCTDVQFKNPESIISKSDAEKILFENFGYVPVYMQVNNKNTVAVYDFERRGITIDAFKGDILNQYSDDKITPYVDMDNHYAKEHVMTLAEFGLGFAEGEFKPDVTITQGEYLTLLSAIFGSNHTPIIFKDNYDFSSAYRYAERFGISDMDDDQPLTRESACVMLVKAMGYDEIARMEDLFVNRFSDVTQNIGYVSILNGMKVINGDGNGNFHPQKELTRAEAAIIIYNYLYN